MAICCWQCAKVVGWFVRGQAWVAECVVVVRVEVLWSVYRFGNLAAGIAVAAAAGCTDCACVVTLGARLCVCASLGRLVWTPSVSTCITPAPLCGCT
jgi:hypothetical protein